MKKANFSFTIAGVEIKGSVMYDMPLAVEERQPISSHQERATVLFRNKQRGSKKLLSEELRKKLLNLGFTTEQLNGMTYHVGYRILRKAEGRPLASNA